MRPFSAFIRRLRFDGDLFAAATIGLTTVVIGSLIFGSFLFPHPMKLGYDEGYMVAFAERLIDGHWLPYVDGVSQRGPVLYWVLAVAQLLTGRYEWLGIRLVGLGGCLVTIVAMFLAGVAARWPLGGALGGAASIFVISVGAGMLGVYGESVAAPCLAVSFALLAFALCRAPAGRRRLGLIALAGTLASLATLTKQTSGIASGPYVMWILVHSWAEADEAGTRQRRFAWCVPALVFVAAWAVPFLAVVAWYAAHGALSELVYWSSTYNSTIYMRPYRGRYWTVLGIWFLKHGYALAGLLLFGVFAVARPAALATSRSVRDLARAYARTGFEVTAALTAIGLFLTALLPARFWKHYFMIAWPWVGVVVGVLIELGLRRGAGATSKKQGAVAAAIVIALASTGAYRLHVFQHKRATGSWPSPRPDAICAHIDEYAPPGESIFVWGFDADLYITCRRKSASRYTYLTLVAGIVPPFWKRPSLDRVARDARETLLADLEQSRPAVIVDVPIHGFTMDRVPELSALLVRDYCWLPRVTGKQKRRPRFYGRRDLGICPERPEDDSGSDAPDGALLDPGAGAPDTPDDPKMDEPE